MCGIVGIFDPQSSSENQKKKLKIVYPFFITEVLMKMVFFQTKKIISQ